MGANAATKCWKVAENVERILAIELMNAAQAISFRRPLKTSPTLEGFLAHFAEQVSFVSEDRVLYHDLHAAEQFLREVNIG